MTSGFAWTSPPRSTTTPVHSGGGRFLSRPPFTIWVSPVQEFRTCSPSPTPPDNQRPRLRIRLTLGRLPLPRNPQASGVAGSYYRHSRYSFRHSRLWSLHPPFRSGFTAPTTLPYHVTAVLSRRASAASGDCLSPVTLSAQGHSTSELLRTLSRMAASKPTSWLSARPHHLSHSAASWGP